MDLLTQRHQCLIYEKSPSDHLRALSQTLVANLRSNKRCLYLNSPAMVAGMRCSLAALGVDPTAETERGALSLTSDQSHLRYGKFDVDLMLDMLRNAVQLAIAEGYVGLWASGDITWELGGESNFDKLVEYEKRLDLFMQDTPQLSGVCQYHSATLPSHAIKTGLRTHPITYINETLSRLNTHYRLASLPKNSSNAMTG